MKRTAQIWMVETLANISFKSYFLAITVKTHAKIDKIVIWSFVTLLVWILWVILSATGSLGNWIIAHNLLQSSSKFSALTFIKAWKVWPEVAWKYQ